MQAVKQQALDVISHLPEDVDLEEIMYRLYVLDKIRKGREAKDRGEVISDEELGREIEKW
jgi:hypothetical protein